MYLRLRIRPNEFQAAPSRESLGYRIRPSSFGASLGLHVLVVTILFSNPLHDRSGKTTLYQAVIQPQEHKIIFYDFRKKLPEVKPGTKSGAASKPRGQELSRQTLVAASSRPKSQKQFIWQPFPKIELPRDLPLPNLIARANTALPPPPPTPIRKKLETPASAGVPSPKPNPSLPDPKGDVQHAEHAAAAIPKPAPKAFVLPSAAPRAHAPVQPTMMDAPDAGNALRAKSAPNSLAALKLRKTFLPPPPEAQRTGPSGTGLMAAPSAGLAASASRGVRSDLPEGLGAPSLSEGVAPPPNAPLGTAISTGNANADMAIAGLHPAKELNGPLPDGARSGRFGRAPTLGDPSGGDGGGSGALTVPDLSIHEGTPRSADAASLTNVNRKAVLYSETVRSIPVATLSVPLRPSARTIPAAIDARFQGRSVYTMVVPIENLPDYGGDWIVWFAERNQKPGDAPSMRAPLPFRKLEPADSVISGDRVERRVQVAAVIKQDGTVDGISLVKGAPPALAQAVIQDLQSWEFKPATRGGTPVDVDVVVEIPFNLSVEVASAGSK